MEIEIRQGRPKDINKFLKFFKEKLGEHFPYYSKNSISYITEFSYGKNWLRDVLKNGKKEVFLAFNKNKIISYLLVGRSYAGVTFCDWLAVDSKFRGQGIGSRLIKMWEKKAIDEGAHVLQLWTTRFYIPFYKKRGFQLGGLFPKAWHGRDSYLFYKPLREPKEENFLKEYLKSKK